MKCVVIFTALHFIFLLTFRTITYSWKTLSIMAFSITTLSVKGLLATSSIMTLSIMTLCHYAECRCAECRNLFIVKLNVILPTVVMLNVVMLSVVAPKIHGRCYRLFTTVTYSCKKRSSFCRWSLQVVACVAYFFTLVKYSRRVFIALDTDEEKFVRDQGKSYYVIYIKTRLTSLMARYHSA